MTVRCSVPSRIDAAETLVRLMSLLDVSGSGAKGLLLCVLGAKRELRTFAAICTAARARANRPPRCLLSKGDFDPPQPLHHCIAPRRAGRPPR